MAKTDVVDRTEVLAIEEADGVVVERYGFLHDHHLETYEQWFDSKFRLPGTSINFGLDGLIGLVPVVGDIATTGVSAIFLADAIKGGARKRTLAKMVANMAIDFTVGSIPLVGDFFDFAFKSNTKNLALLRAERAHLKNSAARQVQ
ncbi:MAG: DUF4112 domain-containing protein [Pseudomonadota bacterium]